MAPLNGPWPLTCRDDELAGLLAASSSASCRAAVLYGPAGVGKTRLAGALLAAVEADGRPTARVAASHAAAQLPLGALAPVLPRGLDADSTPQALFDATSAAFVELGAGRVPLLLVDDAHLLDTSSAVLVSQLIAAGVVLVVATIRADEPLPDAVATWWRNEGTLRLDLRDLDRASTGDLLAQALGGPVGADAVRRLHLASGGNPLLLRELVLQAVDAGRLADDSGTWRVTGAIPPSTRLVELFATRLAALDGPSRAVVEQLALCAPMGAEELQVGALTGAEVGGIVDGLVHAGLARADEEGRRLQVDLVHPLYGEAVRAQLSAVRRREVVLAAADRVEAVGGRRRDDARRVAIWRLDGGGTPDPALVLQAALVARYAHDFVQVERLATVLDERSPSVEATLLLGEAHYELGRFDAAEVVLSAPVPTDTAEHLLVRRATLRTKNLQWGRCDWEAALRVLAEAEPTVGPAARRELVAERGSVLLFSGRPQAALDLLEAIEPDTDRTRVLIAITRAPALAAVGRTAEAVEVSAAGFHLHAAMADPQAIAHPGTHLVNQAFSLLEAGRLGEAEELAAAGHEVAVADGVPIAQIWFALVLARAESLRGRVVESARWFREGASTARLHGFAGPLRLALAGEASALAVLGRLHDAQAAVAESASLPVFGFLVHDQVLGPAWTAWAAGDPQRARDLLLDEADAAAATDNVVSAVWLLHDAVRLGAPDRAGLAARLGALAARSDSSLVHARAGHAGALALDDPAALEAAADAFAALGATLLAAEALAQAAEGARRSGSARRAAALALRSEALAARCPGARTPALAVSSGSAALSGREREVAGLAAGGLSSQEIADRLFVSIRTVDNHLQKTYAKLGIHRRDELAAALGR